MASTSENESILPISTIKLKWAELCSTLSKNEYPEELLLLKVYSSDNDKKDQPDIKLEHLLHTSVPITLAQLMHKNFDQIKRIRTIFTYEEILFMLAIMFQKFYCDDSIWVTDFKRQWYDISVRDHRLMTLLEIHLMTAMEYDFMKWAVYDEKYYQPQRTIIHHKTSSQPVLSPTTTKTFEISKKQRILKRRHSC